MRVAVASDHGGFIQKAPLIAYIESLGHEVVDFGCDSEDRCDYPDFADMAARALSRGEVDRAVLICGTGIGMALTADKVPGVRAAAIQSLEFVELFRAHNNGNCLCVSGRFSTFEMNQRIVRSFFETPFEGGRHEVRVNKIMREDDPDFPGVREEDVR